MRPKFCCIMTYKAIKNECVVSHKNKNQIVEREESFFFKDCENGNLDDKYIEWTETMLLYSTN